MAIMKSSPAVWSFRQRSTDGNSIMQTQMQFHFKPIAYNATNSALQQRLFQQWIYLTQASHPCIFKQENWSTNLVGCLLKMVSAFAQACKLKDMIGVDKRLQRESIMLERVLKLAIEHIGCSICVLQVIPEVLDNQNLTQVSQQMPAFLQHLF